MLAEATREVERDGKTNDNSPTSAAAKRLAMPPPTPEPLTLPKSAGLFGGGVGSDGDFGAGLDPPLARPPALGAPLGETTLT